jgi:hypothetical protein
MASSLLDICRFNPTAGGTTDWTYSSAVIGCQSPSAAGAVNGASYSYRAESNDLAQWEIGTGTYNTGTGVLTRAAVLFNSLGTTAKINFSTVPQVAIVALAEDLLSFNAPQPLTTTQQTQARQNIYAAPFDALAYSGIQWNGAFEISQERGTIPVNGNGNYICDGWFLSKAGTMAVDVNQAFSNLFVGFQTFLSVVTTTAQASLGSTDFVAVTHPIEGFRCTRLYWGQGANAQPLSIGFWSAHHRPGVYSGVIRNGATNRSFTFAYTQSAADIPQFNAITIPGDVAGSWNISTGVGLFLTLAVAAGSGLGQNPGSWQSASAIAAPNQINGVAATSDAFRITGVVVLPGVDLPSSANPGRITRPFDQELLLCQRYLYIGKTNVVECRGFTDGAQAFIQNTIPLRVAPTMTHPYSDATFTIADPPGASQWNAQLTGVNTVTKTGTVLFTVSGNAQPGQSMLLLTGCTFNRTFAALFGGTALGNIKLDARF